MNARIRVCSYLILAALWPACEREEPLPSNEELAQASSPQHRAIPPDGNKAAMIDADRRFSIANLAFIAQKEAADPGRLWFTLYSTTPGLDGARLLLSDFQHAETVADLARSPIYMSAGAHLNEQGNGIFTATSAYQPKFASMTLTKVLDSEVRGTVTGDFYLFNRTSPLARPKVIEVSMDFVAALIVK